jgi:hypothetical protein
MLQTLPGRVRPVRVFTAQAQPLKQKRTELTLHSPPQYRTPQGSTKTLLTHILKQHLTEEGSGDAVAPEDAQIFLATKSAAKFAPPEVYQEFKAKQDQTGGHEFDNTRFQLKILRWLVIGQQPFLEVESEALQCAFEECCSDAHLKSRGSYHHLLFKVLDLERQKLRELLQKHDGLFNFTCDCWSDTEQEQYLGESGCPSPRKPVLIV